MRVAVVLLRVSLVGLFVVLPMPGIAQQGIPLEEVAALADPSVGRVIARYSESEQGTGSGFVLSTGPQAGTLLFLTNNHVSKGAEEIFVGFLDGDLLFVYRGSAVAVSEAFDLAVLLLEPEQHPASHQVGMLGIRADLARFSINATLVGNQRL
jgi:S1-C subfamily serine protease